MLPAARTLPSPRAIRPDKTKRDAFLNVFARDMPAHHVGAPRTDFARLRAAGEFKATGSVLSMTLAA